MGGLPRFFVGEAPAATPGAAQGQLHAVDFLQWDGQDLAVVADDAGQLMALPGAQRGAWPAGLRRALNFHELAGPLRRVHARELWLLRLERLEALGPVPGLNDPIDASGVLYGPLRAGDPTTGTPLAAPGRLTTTRGELLDSILLGSWHPFRIAGASAEARGITCLHLAGADESSVREGQALVLAYPLSPGHFTIGDGGNDRELRELLHELLSALRADQQEEGIGTLRNRELPVVSRTSQEATLAAQGFEIAGDVARRPRRGLLGRLLPEKIDLRPTAPVREFFDLARVALAELPGWPQRRARAVHELLALPELSWSTTEPRGLTVLPVGSFEIVGDALVSSPPAPSRQGKTRKEKIAASWRCLWFAVDPAFSRHCGPRLQLEIEYRDDGAKDESESLGSLYNSVLRPDKSGVSIPLRGTGEWRRHMLELPDAKLGGADHHGADFRVAFSSLDSIRLRRVTLRRVPAAAATTATTPARGTAGLQKPRVLLVGSHRAPGAVPALFDALRTAGCIEGVDEAATLGPSAARPADAETLAALGYDVYLWDHFAWSAVDYGQPQVIATLWRDLGQNVITTGNDTTSGLYPVRAVVASPGVATVVAPDAVHPLTQDLRAAGGVGDNTDAAIGITDWAPEFVPLYASAAHPAHKLVLLGHSPSGGVWLHDQTGFLHNAGNSRVFIARVLDYMTSGMMPSTRVEPVPAPVPQPTKKPRGGTKRKRKQA